MRQVRPPARRATRLVDEGGLNALPAVSQVFSSLLGNSGAPPLASRTSAAAFSAGAVDVTSEGTGAGRNSSVTEGRLLCAKSAVLKSSSELSLLNGTLMLVPPFFLEVNARVIRRERAVMDHGLPQVFGARLATAVSQRDIVCSAVIFDHQRVVHGNVGSTLFEIAHGYPRVRMTSLTS